MTRIVILAGVAMLGGGALLVAAEKRPLSVDDLYRQESVSDFTISPRGDEAVYVRSWYDANHAGRRTALWRIDGATGRHEPLEPGEPDGRMPVYSPDGRQLAFMTDRANPRGERNGISAIPVYSERSGGLALLSRSTDDGGELSAAKLKFPNHSLFGDTFFARITFAPDADGFALVVRRDVLYFDESPAASGQGRRVPEDLGEGYEGYGEATVFVSSLYSKTPTPAFAGDVTPSRPKHSFGDPQWMPNSDKLIAHANRTDDQESVRYSINKNYDLWEISPNATSVREPKSLTTNPGPDVSPRISPDGKHVLYLSVPRKGPHADVYNLCVLPLEEEDAKPRVIVNAHDAERDADGTPPFQPTFPLRDDSWIDAEHVRVRGVRGMKSETRVFHIRGGEVAEAVAVRAEPALHENKHFRPPATNAWMNERYSAREEIVKWKSFDGLEIEGVLTLPPAELTEFMAPYPVIVYPHGGPHSTSRPGFNFAVHLFAAKGYAVFQPNFRGTNGYGRKFLDAARFDMGGSDMQDILTGVDRLIERGTIDAQRQFVYGISYGGYSTCRLVTLTDRFRAAVAQNAVTDLHAMWALGDLQSWTEWEFGGKPWETVEVDGRTIDVGALMRDRSPTTQAYKVKTPTLLLHSDHDRRCPLAMGQMFHRHLKENGCETELVVYQDERHGLWQVRHQADVLERVLKWFAQHDAR